MPDEAPDYSTEVMAALEAVKHPTRRADAIELERIFREVTGWPPRLWGSIVGYGSYHYRYASGREGDCQATGFRAGAANLSIYIMPGYQDFGEILSRLGKHKAGKACVTINKLDDIDREVLAELIRAGLQRLDEIYAVTPG